MSLQILSGSARLVCNVREYFRENDVTAEVAFGDRALSFQSNQGPGRANRVVFCPFVPKSGAAGKLMPPSQFGNRDMMSASDPTVRVATVRALFDWERLFILSVWARDTELPEDDLAQHCAAETLLEDTCRAVHVAGFASVDLGAIQVVPQGERRFGVELRVELRFTHPLYDLPKEIAYPGFDIDKTTT